MRPNQETFLIVKHYYRTVLILGLTLLLSSGCSDSETSSVDKVPFKNAIHEYLDTNHMDMKVAEFKEISVNDGTATAEVSLMHAKEVVDVHVTWTFQFRKENDTWRVTKHEPQ